MDIDNIIRKIEQPLLFSARDDFSRLHLVRGLEENLSAWTQTLSELIQKDRPDGNGELLQLLRQSFADFDRQPLEIKKSRILEALSILATLKGRAGQDNGPDNGPEERGASIDGCAPDRPGVTECSIPFDKLDRPIQFIKGVGPRLAAVLEKKNVRTILDLLYFLPRRYEDRRNVKSVVQAAPGRVETVAGRVVEARIQQYRHKKVFEVAIKDDTGILTASWFKGHPSYLKSTFKTDLDVLLTGEVRVYNGLKNMVHPDFEILDERDDMSLNFRRIVPLYSETEGLHQKTVRRLAMTVLDDFAAGMHSPIPQRIKAMRNLPDLGESLRAVHFPGDTADVGLFNDGQSVYHRGLIYDEFFIFELGMAMKKQGHVFEEGVAFKTGGPLVEKFYKQLPFTLTGAQRRVIHEIEADLQKRYPMNRLLQGDVGSGKTAVAMAAMVAVCENGYQCALMAPTEILAEQHYRTIRAWAEPLGLNAALVTGSRKGSGRKEALMALKAGDVRILVGTHALIQEDIDFQQLGLAVIDEQHRFGVMQRAAIRDKGAHPDILVMTATPIPRTLAMTVYGDLDVSVIDELPPAKKPIKTLILFESQRERVYGLMRGELAKGHQVFVVYPLVEESEGLDLKDATRMAEVLQETEFQNYRVGLIHGKMKSREKDRIMSAFLRKEIHILVATTVIEVGIDIPEASLMVIEHAERFGLSQLHQLRGRVGRSGIPGTCILLAQYSGSEDAKKRLRVMEKTNDGFRIAEEDLAIRGPGEFMGTRQSGLPDFRVANILRDGRILNEARTDAFSVAESDPKLEKPEHRALKETLMHRWAGRLELAKTG